MSNALKELTTTELENLLKERKKEEAAARAAKREQYESEREALIDELGEAAVHISNLLRDLKVESMMRLTQHREKMLEYGDIRRGERNKGSFQIKNDNFKIVFKHHVNKSFDERAELAEKKLKDFLATFVKKRDKNSYELVIALLERNQTTGDFDVNLINRLYKMRDKFDNPLWHEALDLFQESYSPSNTAQYIQFLKRDPSSNAYATVVLEFSKISSANALPETTEA